MARETWLRPNRRVLTATLILPGLLLVAGTVVVWSSAALAGEVVGWGLLVVGLCITALTLHALRQPRLAYDDGELLVYLRAAAPIRVPIDVVECFFLGQGPSLLSAAKARDDDDDAPETSTVVVRLAESAEDWHHATVKPALGHWCDGYITVRGTWCEPLTADVVQRLNERLVQAHRRIRAGETKEPA